MDSLVRGFVHEVEVVDEGLEPQHVGGEVGRHDEVPVPQLPLVQPRHLLEAAETPGSLQANYSQQCKKVRHVQCLCNTSVNKSVPLRNLRACVILVVPNMVNL